MTHAYYHDVSRTEEQVARRTVTSIDSGHHEFVRVFFGCERNLENRPSERIYCVDNLAEAWEEFREAHNLEDDSATRAAVMVECI